MAIVPDSKEVLNNLGELFFKQSAFENALDVLNRSLLIDGKQVDQIYNLSVVLGKMGRYDQVAQALERILSIQQIPEIHAELADLYRFELNDNNAAIHHMWQYVRNRPDTETGRAFKKILNSATTIQ